MAVFAELRRRNVLKVALLYAIASWLLLLLVGATAEALGLPVWTETFVLLLLTIGFPVALIFAWTYEITPGGLKKAIDVEQTQSIVYKTGQKLNAAVAVLLVLGVLAVLGQGLLPTFEFLVPGIPEGDPPAAPEAPQEIRSLTLDNGLKIIVWPDHDIPNVVLYNYVRAGSRNEYPGITGLAHFFEHMMFQSTSTLEPGEFDRIMEAAGGSANAGTSKDITVYQNWFPKSALEIIVKLEADRLQNLFLDADTIESERGVIISERRSGVDDDNFSRLFEQVYATAYIAHPYQYPIIGWPSDIEAWTEADLVNYFGTYYAPNNCTMVFTGDVTPEEIFELAEEYLAGIPAQEPPPPVRTVEPRQEGVRRITIETAAQTPLLHLAFHAGRAIDKETLPLTLLLDILAGGDSSRLHRLLVEEQQAVISVDGWYEAGLDPGLVYFYLTLPPGGEVASVEEAVLVELQRVIDDGVTAAELAKAQNRRLANYWRGLATINGKAEALGDHELLHGSYEKLFEQPAAVEAISVEDLRNAAAVVFQRSNMTVGVLQAPAAETGP